MYKECRVRKQTIYIGSSMFAESIMAGVILFFTTLILGLLPIQFSDILYFYKWILSYISLRLYKRTKPGRLDFYDPIVIGKPDVAGYLPHSNEEKMESPRSEAHLRKAEDGVFFYGVDSKGDCLVVSIGRQCNHKAEATLLLRLASGKVFELVKKSDFQQATANQNAFTCGGLMAYYERPMKTWRIFYSGFLRETSATNRGNHRMTYVKFSFLWRSSSDVYDCRTDLNESRVAESVARENWKSALPPTHELFNVLDFYAQAGVIMGNLILEEAEETHELYLFGERIRFLGEAHLSKEISFSHTLGFIHKTGKFIHFGEASFENIAKNVNYGFVVKPCGLIRKLENLKLSVKDKTNEDLDQEIKATICADRDYNFCGTVVQPSSWISSNDKSISISEISFFLDGKKGTGFYIAGWRSSSDVYDCRTDLNESRVAESVARENWKSALPPTHELFNVLDFYAQAGVIMGNLILEEAEETHELYLFGERIRFLGEAHLSKEISFSHTLGFIHKTGKFIHFGEASFENIAKNVNYGFVVKPCGLIRKLENLKLSVKDKTNEDLDQEIKATICADRDYNFCGTVVQPSSWISSNDKSISISEISFFLDGKKGTGFYIAGKYHMSTRRPSEIVPPVVIPECVHPMVVAFTEELCQLPELTGGKGSSLGKLTSLSEELQSFTVPPGVVVTTASYKRFVDEGILNEIKCLENVLYGNKEGDPKDASKSVCDKIMATNIPNPIMDSIFKNLKNIYGDKCNTTRFAIRSSATGEDTEQMSAAGQMETFLGITGLQNILIAVKKCWASQFGFTAIQYKKRYGQYLNSPMAVVIQEMVACDVAGVIFTCDPVTGSGSKMSIAANFGLGESVVSASVDPDNIELARDAEDELRIHYVRPGQKTQKIVLTDVGTTFEDNPENERDKCCLSTEDIFRLGNLAIKIEKCYRSKRDIEWGIKSGNLFLFQSRPVTSGMQETDFEIDHEFDAALRVENDYFSVSNAAEVLPGAITPLGRDVFFKELKSVWQSNLSSALANGVRARYFDNSWVTFSNHMMFNVPDIFHSAKPGGRNSGDRAMMVAFFGRIVESDGFFQLAYDRFHDVPNQSWKKNYDICKSLVFAGKFLRKNRKFFSKYQVPVENCSTSKEMFDVMMAHCGNVAYAFSTHLRCSELSSLWNMLILTILSENKKDIDTDTYTDFAKLVTIKGDVESADVPAAIEDLVSHITKSIKPEDFKAMTPEEALQWLRETPSSAGKKFSEFLTKHGHRCVSEFDIYSTTWGTNPAPLVQLIQKLVGTKTHEMAGKENPSLVKLLSQLKTPLGWISKLKLLLIVPLSRRGVTKREATKSTLIKGMDSWRKPFRALAKRMVSEGRIPNEDILFFMTLEDIKELLETRSPKVIARAYHRQRLHPLMNEYKYPEIMKGIPRPIKESENGVSSTNGSTCMQGLPVSQGVAKGFLRVAITLDEATDLKPGEILLAYGTDIGWTPYFPSLAGVATELGGLISHGAVVSREYGLPCVAALQGATRIFHTGDYVLLDGNKGLLKKIPPSTE